VHHTYTILHDNRQSTYSWTLVSKTIAVPYINEHTFLLSAEMNYNGIMYRDSTFVNLECNSL